MLLLPPLLYGLLAQTAHDSSSVPVFRFGEGGWPCTRIPSVVLTNTTLLAFAECRPRTGDGCLPVAPIQPTRGTCVCMKRSTNSGASWDAAPKCVGPEGVPDEQVSGTAGALSSGGSNQPLAAVERKTGKAILHFNAGANHTVHQITSTE